MLSAEQLVLAEAEERGRVVFFTTVSKRGVPSSSELQKEVSARAKCLSVPSGVCHLRSMWDVVFLQIRIQPQETPPAQSSAASVNSIAPSPPPLCAPTGPYPL